MSQSNKQFIRRISLFSVLFYITILPTLAQKELKVNGNVVDEKNEPLPGVNITIQGKNNGVVTDNNGNFSLIVPDEQSIIVFSYIGYQKKIFIVGKNRIFAVRLIEDSKTIDEVVVVGYGTMKKSDLTGSISQVSTAPIISTSQSNFQNYLQGRSAGVQVSSSSGDPGATVKIEIRGANSLNASTEPLYVIDGTPMDINISSSLSNVYAGGITSNPMATINPNDILSLEVLKDASATAIYGSRGANGVILITTKSGQSGAPHINVNFSHSTSMVSNKIELLNAAQYVELSNEAKNYRYPNTTINFTNEEIAKLKNYNHQSAIFQIAETKDLNINVSGGDNKTKYFLSGQYYNQEGIIINTGLSRYNVKLNFERELKDKLRLNLLLNISRTESDGSTTGGWNGGVIASALRWAPTSPLLSANGQYNNIPNYMVDEMGVIKERFATQVTDASSYINNPLAIVNEMKNHNTNTQILGNIGLTYLINKYLKANAKLSITTYNALLEAYRPTTVPIIGSATNGYATLGNSHYLKQLYEGTLSYNRNVKKHYFDGVIGTTLESTITNAERASAKDFILDITGYNAIQSGGILESPYSEYDGSQLISFLMRGNYHFDYKYYLTFSGRVDGSSKFSEGNRWGFFPSIGLSWRMQKEDWLKDIEQINNLKLRVSYGLTGNQAIPSYQTLLLLNSSESKKTNYNFGNTINPGYAPVNIPNKDLTWEQTKQLNFGLDLNMFTNRLNFVVDLYNKETNNLLFNVDLPATSGSQKMYVNVGSVRNTGLELTLNGYPIKIKKFSWNSSFNISWNKNEVTKLSGKESEVLYVGELISNLFVSRLEVGKPIGSFYGYVTDGIWDDASLATKPTTFQPGAKAGDRRYKNIKSDDQVLDANDRTYIGSSLPIFIGGFSNSFQYSNIELAFFFNFSYGNKMFNQLLWDIDSMDGTNNASINALNRWRPITSDMSAEEQAAQIKINSSTNVPRAGNYSSVREVSDYFVQDASYIRCSNISLTWSLPSNLLSRLKLNNLKLIGSVQNLFTLTKYQGYSPEGNSYGTSNLVRGVDNGLYPPARTFKVGISASF